MIWVRAWYGFCLALVVQFGAPQALAQTNSRSSPDSASARAGISLFGEAARSPELRELLTELLERDNVNIRFVERKRFESADVLGGSSNATTLDVFIVPRGRDAARLYFRAPDGKRFLVRDVPLGSGLDALGRESIAQVVEASVVSLLHSEAGLSRAAFERELGSEPTSVTSREIESGVANAPSKPTSSVEQEQAESSRSNPAVASRSRSSLALAAWIAAKYAVHWSGAGLAAQSGPGFELGLGLRRELYARARFSLEFDFPAGLSAEPIDARVTTERWRALLDVGTSIGQSHALALSIGAGQDRSNIEPTGSHDPSLRPSVASRSTPAILHSEARFEAGVADFRLVFAALLEVPLLHTPYQVDVGSSVKQLGEPWSVRPGAAFSLAWQPQLGSL